MKKILLIVLITLTTTVFSNNNIKEVVSSESTNPENPGEYAVDGDSSRGWELKATENDGWLILKLDSYYRIDGIILDGILSTGSRLSVSYKDRDNIYRDFFTSLNRAPINGKILDLSYDKAVTDEIKIKINETDSLRSLITGIELIKECIESGIKLQVPDEISSSRTTSVYSPEFNLVDGNPETYWRIENNLDWPNVQWAVRQYLENRYDYDRFDSWGNSGSVEFEFDDIMLEKIRFYVPDSVEGSYRLEIESDNDRITIADGIRLKKGWIETSFDLRDIDEVRLTVISDDQNDFPEIGEVEFWGINRDLLSDDNRDKVEYLTPEYDTAIAELNEDLFFKWDQENKTPEIEVVVLKDNKNKLVLNGIETSPYRTIDLDETEIKIYKPDNNELVDGYNFIKLQDNIGLRLRYRQDEGYLSEEKDTLHDGLLYSSRDIIDNEIILLDSPVLIERLEVFTSDSSGAAVYAYIDYSWVELYKSSSENKKTTYYGDVTTDQIKISYGNSEIKEVRIWGSEYPDIVPEIKILYPPNGIDLQSHEPGYNVLVGEIDQPGCFIEVNGVEAKTYGNIFWVELKKLKLPKAGIVELRVIAENGDGIVNTNSVNILLQHNGYRDSVDGDEVIFTNKSTYTIEGVSNQWRSRLYINEKEYSIDGHSFSHEIELKPGYNNLKIEFKDKKGRLVKLFFKTVYRYTADLALEISSSLDNVITKKDYIRVTGFVKGFGDTEVEVNGEEAEVKGFSFQSDEIKLNEGNNLIKVVATDESGNRKEKVITVIRDTVAPSISNIKPVNGAIISTEEVIFTGDVSDDLGTRIFVNGYIAEIKNNKGFSRELLLSDGLNGVEIYAIDRAGNISGIYKTEVLTDTKAPDTFIVYADPDSWTNNTTPEITFSTTDATSGVAYYELKTDNGIWRKVTSPHIMDTLTDGVHNLFVRAVDRAGHSTSESTKLFIDTTPPGKPEIFRAIPKKNTVELEWTPSVSADTKEYRLKRTPEWAEGFKILNKETLNYTDDSVEENVCYEYEINSVDRADNLSETVTSEKAIVGLEVKEYNNQTGSVVEYEDIAIIVPEESLPDDILEIHVTEVESPDLVEKAHNYIIGSIYNTSVVRSINGNRVHQEHVAFEKDFLATISYNEEDLPDGIIEQNIGVYYFDPMWGRWFLVEDSSVDRDNNRILFKTNHFTDFSVQPILSNELTPQEYKSMGVSPNVNNGHSGVSVDPQSGTLSMTVDEFNLPGEAGFDFTLRRTYNSVRARKDSFNMALAAMLGFEVDPSVEIEVRDKLKSLKVKTKNEVYSSMVANLLHHYKSNGDYSYSMGSGWRLDLPSINSSSSYINITLPGGAIYGVNQMELLDPDIYTSDYSRTLEFENHRNIDFKLIIKQEREDINTSKLWLTNPSLNIGQIVSKLHTKKVNSWSMIEADLILKNGTKYSFDKNGRIKEITDPYGTNSVTFEYNKDKLSTITDSIGRIITFGYTKEDANRLVPSITSIAVKNFNGDDKTIEYTIDDSGYMGLLTEATDLQGRSFTYGYGGNTLFAGSDTKEVKKSKLINNFLNPGGINSIADEIVGVDELELDDVFCVNTIDALTSVSGSGIGDTSINYTSRALVYSSDNDLNNDFFNGLYPTEDGFSYDMLQTLVVSQKTVTNNTNIKTTNYSYDFKYAGLKQFTNSKTVVNDGKKTIEYNFVDFHIENNRWIDLSTISRKEFKEHFNKYSLYPMISTIKLKDNDTVINTQHFNYDPLTVRLDSKYETQSSSLNKEVSNKYDDWGNVVYQKESSSANGRTTEVETWIDYFGTENSNEYSGAITPQPNYTFTNDDSDTIKNLVKSVVVKNGNTIQAQYFDYNSDKRLNDSNILSNNSWLKTSYEYDSFGNIEKITDPKNNITTYTWDYSDKSRWYTLTEVVENVDIITETGTKATTNITTKSAFEYNTGLLAWTKNPNGYITEYCYDSLGRLLRTDKDSKTTESADPLIETYSGITSEPTARLAVDNSRAFFEKITYNDTEFKATVINAKDQVTTYSYNILGQLTDLEKSMNSTSISTSLTYDNWGNVVSITNPKDDITEYGYDSFGKNTSVKYPGTDYGDGTIQLASKSIDFDYATNTQTVTDERGEKTYKVFDINSNVIETGYFKNKTTRIPLSRTTYDGLGNVITSTDAKGNVTTYEYNERNMLVKTTFPEEEFYEADTKLTPYVRYDYNDLGQRIREYRSTKTAGREYKITFNTDVLGRVYEVVTPVTNKGVIQNISQKFVFDDNGNNTCIIDGSNNKTSFEYNYLNQLTSKTDSENNTTTYTHDRLGNITNMSDPREEKAYDASFTITYHYDYLNRIVKADLPRSYGYLKGNSIEFEYDFNSNVSFRSEKDGLGNLLTKTGYTYNKRNMLLTEYQVGTDNVAKAFETKYKYNKSGLRIEVEDSSQKTAKTAYDELGRVILLTHGSGVKEEFIWDLNGNKIEFIDGKGNTTKTAYDSYNRVKSISRLVAGGTDSVVKYKYDERGNRIYFEDGINNVTRYSFDELNRMISETNSRGFEATFSYDNVGNIKNKTDFNGSQFTYDYKANNLLNRVDIINGSSSKALTYEYDEAGGLMSSTDDSVVTKYNFVDDGSGSIKYQPDPFDKILRITTELDGKSYNIDYDYDSAGRVKNITYPTAHSVESTYNQFGQLASLGDYIDGSISYYNNGLLNGYKLSNGVNYSSSYDVDNRLLGFKYIDNASASLDSYAFGYDDSNNIIKKVVNGKTNSYSWDALNQLIRADNQGEFEVDPSKLDTVQKVGAVTEDYVGQKSLDFTADDTELKLDYNSISIGFDIGNDTKLNKLVIKPENVVNRLDKNKLALYISSDNNNWSILDREAWSYEIKDEVIVLALTNSIDTRYVKVHCFFDDRDDRGFARDLAEVRNSRVSLLTAYFTVDRMVEGFQYDEAGNREEYSVNYSNGSGYTSTYIYYENSNLIKSDGKFAYVWDRNGNLIEKSDNFTITNNEVTLGSDSGNYTKYSYDLLNRLIKVELSEKGSSNIGKEVTYVYDHRGYRLKRVGSDSNDVTYYSFGLNGEVLYKENQSKDKFEEYIYLFGKHFAKEVGKISTPENRTRLYYHTDHLGSTISITDTNGDRVWSNNYTSFGNSTNEKGLLDELANYTSKEIDPETGLYYFNARWYDPEMGRFITEDPIKDGNNWYAYCMNNPLGYIDPTGLKNEKNDGKKVGDYGRWINSSGTKHEKNKGKKTYNNPGNSPRGNPYGNGNRPNYHGGNYTNNGNKGHTSSSATSSNPGGHYRRGGGNGNSHKVATPTSSDNFDPNYGLNSGSPLNLDFGVDYSGAATKAWDRGHYWNAGVLTISSTCEMAYSALVAYVGAKLVSALVTSAPILFQNSRDFISRLISNIRLGSVTRPFNVNPKKFDYFFGKVVTGPEKNVIRSAQNLKDLNTMGIQTKEQLMNLFDDAYYNGQIVSTKVTEYGINITKSIKVAEIGKLKVSFFYAGGNMDSTPSVTTIIPQIFK